MSENKFIKHLKGVATEGSVLEIKNQATPASFANMPSGDSNPNTVFSDHRGNTTAVLNGTDNWKLNDSALILATTVYGDGQDLTGTFTASGAGLWVNATYSFSSAKIFNGNTKWVLKLCGSNLLAESETIGFTLLVKLNNDTIITKDFTVSEQAGNFCKEFVIDFAEGEPDVVHMESGDTLTVQLLCADSTASATIYNGMTVLTALQRRVAGDAVSSDVYTFAEIEHDLTTHINDKNNPHEVTKAQVGLGNCDNTSDLDKPISTATQTALDGKVSKTGDQMTGTFWLKGYFDLRNTNQTNALCWCAGSTIDRYKWGLNSDINNVGFQYDANLRALMPLVSGAENLGRASYKWNRVYASYLDSSTGGNKPITIPQKTGTMALMSDVELAAQSGRMLTDQGVWYAKMDALGTIPSSAEVEGRNYADFTQVDGNNDPIIVIYTYTSGSWVQTETITPPSAYDGYVPITSKIWDIPEQTGQQGGRILWNHTSKDFTPYPLIMSFDEANITNGAFQGSADLSGTSTVAMPVSPGSTQIVNKDYVDTAIAGVQSSVPLSVDVTFYTSDVNAPSITSDGRIIPNITASHEIIPGMLALDQCEIVLAFEGQHAGAVILWAPSGSNTNSFELTLSSGNLLKLNGVVGVTTIDPAQKYYAKITRVGTTCTLSLSTDGTVFTTECTTTISSLLTTKYSIQTSVGATLYCAECYIVNNGIKIWQGVGSPGLHQRVETGHEVIEFQAPTAQNNYKWYRKYADGWVEQGGIEKSIPNNSNANVTLPVEMADTNYTVTIAQLANASYFYTNQGGLLYDGKYTTYIVLTNRRFSGSATYTIDINWQVSGMAA